MADEHLAVAVGPRADPDRGDAEPSRNLVRDGRGTASSTTAKQPASSSASASASRRAAFVRRPSLRLEATEHGGRLRREADVTHHRDPGLDDRADARQHRPGSLQLHRVRAGLLDEADRVPTAATSETWNEPNGMSAIDERAACATGHGPRQHEHLLHRGRDGRVVAEHRHRGRVADEHEVGPRLVRETAGRRVVRRDHHDRLPALHQRRELGDRQLPGRGRAGSRGAGTCAHRSSSRGTLSIRRVAPTRTAAARTGGSKGATRT